MHPSVVVLMAYLLGSIPFGYVIVRLTKGADVRASGSGGTGATNVTRRAGKWAGILTLALDALKGVAAVLLARRLLAADASGGDWWLAAAALAALLGHIFPVWLGFRGGKGVATGLGIFATLSPLAVASAVALFLLVVWKTRYVSLGSLVATASMPFAMWFWSRNAAPDGTPADDVTNTVPLIFLAATCGALIIFMHRANINRLRGGTENKLKL